MSVGGFGNASPSFAARISADDVGTLVVKMPPTLVGAEIEVDRLAVPPVPGIARRPVLNRPMNGTRVPTVVFADLPDGDYELYQHPAGPTRVRVHVGGGQVTRLDWPA